MTRRGNLAPSGDGDYPLFARAAVLGAELLAQRLLELAARFELLDDVGAADELAADEHLRDRRPAGERRELLADAWVGQHVDRGHGRPRAPKRLERAMRVAAHHELRRALHEQRHVLAVDDPLHLVLNLVAHEAPLVLILSS